MTDAALQAFRDIAEQMQGPAARDWEWVGQHMSQRMFGITQVRAQEYAARHGGTAKRMEPSASTLADRRDMAKYVRALQAKESERAFADNAAYEPVSRDAGNL